MVILIYYEKKKISMFQWASSEQNKFIIYGLSLGIIMVHEHVKCKNLTS